MRSKDAQRDAQTAEKLSGAVSSNDGFQLMYLAINAAVVLTTLSPPSVVARIVPGPGHQAMRRDP